MTSGASEAVNRHGPIVTQSLQAGQAQGFPLQLLNWFVVLESFVCCAVFGCLGELPRMYQIVWEDPWRSEQCFFV